LVLSTSNGSHTLFLNIVLVCAIVTQQWSLLFLVPLAPLSGLVSHALFERNHIDFEDALFSPRAFICLQRMTFGVLTGRYWRQVKEAQKRLSEWQLQQQQN
jgi:hypothetical protein